ncbi:MAG: hypothetical protein M0002_19735 [Rhodospirillales bacterium]|nr:hypothetical protein [Rhodospirillales bacterium]
MIFSERYRFVPERAALQVAEIDTALRNRLLTRLDQFILFSRWQNKYVGWHDRLEYKDLAPDIQGFVFRFWDQYLKKPTASMPSMVSDIREEMRTVLANCWWYQLYDFLEFCLSTFPFSAAASRKEDFVGKCNDVLSQEKSAYRIVANQVTRITDLQEVSAIEEAQDLGDRFATVSLHVNAALRLLSDRKNPDFRNSIKESISAVEAMCGIVAGGKRPTLTDAIAALESKGVTVHRAQRDAFVKLYGYTSDAGGIRHAMLEEATLDFDDAKFMLVACSAFVNLLKARMA